MKTNAPKSKYSEVLIDFDEEYEILSSLPKAIKDYLMYDCPLKTASEPILEFMKTNNTGVYQTLDAIKNAIRKKTILTYGSNHPQA